MVIGSGKRQSEWHFDPSVGMEMWAGWATQKPHPGPTLLELAAYGIMLLDVPSSICCTKEDSSLELKLGLRSWLHHLSTSWPWTLTQNIWAPCLGMWKYTDSVVMRFRRIMWVKKLLYCVAHSTFPNVSSPPLPSSFSLSTGTRKSSEDWIRGLLSLFILPLKVQGWQYLFPCSENVNKPQPGPALIIYTTNHIMCIWNTQFIASH